RSRGPNVDESEIGLIRELIAIQGQRHALPLDEQRREYDRAQEVFSTAVAADVDSLRIGRCPADLVRSRGALDGTRILYLHGGAYVLGSPRSHRHVAAAIGESAAASVLVLDYRRAPEDPFPSAVEDAVSAYEWVLDQGQDPSRLVVAGDSAGGGLALAMMFALRDAGIRLPAAGVCISPWVDLTCAGGSHRAKSESDPVLRTDILRQMAALYLRGANARSALASPIFGNLEGLPPLLVQVGSEEILLDDARELARRTAAAGTPTTLEEWPGMIHVWHWYFPLLKEARAAIATIGEFIRAHTGAAAPAATAPGARRTR
ncbi:MAG: alpha/beta hydrolase, partial [Isosphaeraceae bacterium]|nr:alpha/beta hydrolase [Isosphaeraceae bacterium]